MRSEKAKAGAKAFKKIRKHIRAVKGIQPERDEKYLAFVRWYPCMVCYRTYLLLVLENGYSIRVMAGLYNKQESISRACHMGPHALSRKASDYTVIPMCDEHHEVFGSSIRKLESIGIDYAKLAASLRAQYEKEK